MGLATSVELGQRLACGGGAESNTTFARMACFSGLLLLMALCLFLRASTGLLQSRHHACNPAGAAWAPYSGWRVQQDVRIRPDASLQRSTVLVQCSYGRVVDEHVVLAPADAPRPVPWNTTLAHGLRLARRSRFAHRASDLYLPQTTVGGLYNCTGDDPCRPLLPLVSDRMYDGWSVLHRDGLHVRTPLLYTPDVLDRRYPRAPGWARFLSPSEQYPAPARPPPKFYQLLDSVATLSLPATTYKSVLAYLNALNDTF